MMVFVVISSLRLVHYLSNVHTWAVFFLRHLANTSSMVPFWASTDSGFVPNLGPARPKPRRQEEVVYSPNDSCSHFTQRLFPPKLPQQHTCTIFSARYTLLCCWFDSRRHTQILYKEIRKMLFRAQKKQRKKTIFSIRLKKCCSTR
jgi:hypothetical protein